MCIFRRKTKMEKLVGKVGFADTTFNPMGKLAINGEIYDAISQGKFIEKGNKIKVVSVENSKITVKEV